MADEAKPQRDSGTGRFLTGNNGGGRPKGSRNKLGEAFVESVLKDFEQYGEAAIVRVRTERPHEYLKVIASLLPKDVNLNHDVSDAFVKLWGMISDGATPELADRVAQEQEQPASVRH